MAVLMTVDRLRPRIRRRHGDRLHYASEIVTDGDMPGSFAGCISPAAGAKR